MANGLRWRREPWGFRSTSQVYALGVPCVVTWTITPLGDADAAADRRWRMATRLTVPQAPAVQGTSYRFGPLADAAAARAFAETVEMGRMVDPASIIDWNLPGDPDDTAAGRLVRVLDLLPTGDPSGAVFGARAPRKGKGKDADAGAAVRLTPTERALMQEFIRTVTVPISAAVDVIFGPQTSYSAQHKQAAGDVLMGLTNRGLIKYIGDGRWTLPADATYEQLQALVAGFGARPGAPFIGAANDLGGDRRVGRCIRKKMRGESWERPRAVAACLNMDRAGRLGPRGGYHRARRKA